MEYVSQVAASQHSEQSLAQQTNSATPHKMTLRSASKNEDKESSAQFSPIKDETQDQTIP